MKVHIFYTINNGPYGGGNQFLKALRNFFLQKGLYEHHAGKADIILFNSHHQFKELIKLKRKYPDKIFIHRIDGPISQIRENDKETDQLIYKINNYIADATVFQSLWSKRENEKNGIAQKMFNTIITNAPNPEIFNKKNKQNFDVSRKIKIIATSWSHNLIKGFKIYKWLDENLDFNRYEMTFCGNSPYRFKNIKQMPAVSSIELAQILKSHDVYITASQKDPCSNSLIEALHCGLPAIVLNDGGHPEIIRKGGLIFDKQEEIPELIERIKNNYQFFQDNINVPSIENVGNSYLDFFKILINNKKEYSKLNIVHLTKIKWAVLKYQLIRLMH